MHCEITNEQLSAYSLGDLPGDQHQELRQHVASCESCQQCLAGLRALDTTLRNLPHETPSAETILAARRLLSEETRPRREPEILTLEEVAAFLRIEPEELRPFVTDLPAFELGGQIRVRRSKLLEWIEQRERQFGRSSAASTVAWIQAGTLRKGVA
jgi:hypothetical protein